MRYLLLSLVLALGAYGQDPPTLVFDVASIRQNVRRTDPPSIQLDNGVLIVRNFSLRKLILVLYQTPEYRILGGPSWIDEDGWDIQAKTLDDTSADDKALPIQQRNALRGRLALRARGLLADRFGLVFRRETREETTYELRVEKGGPKLEPAQEGVVQRVDYRIKAASSGVDGVSVDIQTLAQILSGRLASPVVDKTGISGRFNFKLDWIPQIGQPGAFTRAGAPELVGPSIFTAVKEELGLRLEATKGPLEVIVVERAERPTEN